MYFCIISRYSIPTKSSRHHGTSLYVKHHNVRSSFNLPEDHRVTRKYITWFRKRNLQSDHRWHNHLYRQWKTGMESASPKWKMAIHRSLLSLAWRISSYVLTSACVYIMLWLLLGCDVYKIIHLAHKQSTVSCTIDVAQVVLQYRILYNLRHTGVQLTVFVYIIVRFSWQHYLYLTHCNIKNKINKIGFVSDSSVFHFFII